MCLFKSFFFQRRISGKSTACTWQGGQEEPGPSEEDEGWGGVAEGAEEELSLSSQSGELDQVPIDLGNRPAACKGHGSVELIL